MTKTAEVQQPARECAIIAAQAADEKKASDIMVQHVEELIGVTDYFVIATARNDRQVAAIIDAIEEDLRVKGGIKPLHREDKDDTWQLLDYGSIVVHVFQPETRDYYRLEELWHDAPVMDLAAEAGLTDVQYSDRIAQLLAEAKAKGAEEAQDADGTEDEAGNVGGANDGTNDEANDEANGETNEA